MTADAILASLPNEWVKAAACRDLAPEIKELFFPERGEDAHEVKAICAACPVQPECLHFALSTNETDGIWGGLAPRERRRIRRLGVTVEEARDPWPPSPPKRVGDGCTCGLVSTYNAGCRCGDCRRVKREAKQLQRVRARG